jgi:2'-5' RNA ligase
VQPSQSLLALHQAVGTALAGAAGFRSETRPYSPHVTLARLDQGVSSDAAGDFLERHMAFQMESVRLQQYGLYSSRFIDGIPHYAEVASFRLAPQ